MPHQCTNCGHVFPDGSKEMLSGCPDCGGNKFQFKQGSVDDVTNDPDDPSEQQVPSDGPDSQQAAAEPAADDSASAAGSDPTGDSPTGDSDTTTADPQTPDSPPTTADPSSPTASDAAPTESSDAELMDSARSQDAESPAQSTARTDVVSDDELPDAPPTEPHPAPPDESHGSSVDSDPPADEADTSGLDELREELNDQFESIRIVSPGQYELNLMELYDRNEYIISLREDGRYVIEVPDGWGTDESN